MFSALADEKWLFIPFVFNKFSALGFGKIWADFWTKCRQQLGGVEAGKSVS
jgi:hypothetical protein